MKYGFIKRYVLPCVLFTMLAGCVQLYGGQAANAQSSQDTAETIQADVDAYQAAVQDLSAEASAQQWLALWDRQGANTPTSPNKAKDVNLDDENPLLKQVMLALPPPDHWPALDQAITARPRPEGGPNKRELALRMFGKLLINDDAGKEQAFAEILSASGIKPDAPSVGLRTSDWWVMHNAVRGPLPRVADFEMLLKVDVPDGVALDVSPLVDLLGHDQAREMLLRALTTTNYRLSTTDVSTTRPLAKQLALEHVKKLRAPQWSLVDSPDDVALYEALKKRFPARTDIDLRWLGIELSDVEEFDSDRDEARKFYQLGLIKQGRHKEALTVQRRYLDDDFDIFNITSPFPEWPGELAPQTYEFAKRLFRKDPAKYRRRLLDNAIAANQTAEAVALLRAACDDASLATQDREQLTDCLTEAHFASGHIDEAVHLLKKTANNPPLDEDDWRIAETLVRLGILLDRPPLIEEGLAMLKAMPQKLALTANSGIRVSPEVKNPQLVYTAQILVELGREKEAADLLAAASTPTTAQQASADKQGNKDSTNDRNQFRLGTQKVLTELVGLYREQSDLAPLISFLKCKQFDDGLIRFLTPNSEQLNEGIHWAAVLDARGKPDQARAMLRVALNRSSDYDPVYALLVQLYPDKQQAIARLDEQFAADPHEERPLIWKADLLLADGKLTEAEATIRQAIAMDPADADQPEIDRLRGYRVLAAILGAQGQPAEAQRHRQLVQAVEMSAAARKLGELGLHHHAVERYQAALQLFPDAFCIQLDLAHQLHSMGRFVEAETHLRRVYELLPYQIGSISSFTNGCYPLPDSEFSRRVADSVLPALAQQQPNHPGVHYLLGELRHRQGRDAEALRSFQQAVQIDPEYINAWRAIRDLYRFPVSTIWEPMDENFVNGWQSMTFADLVPAALRETTELQLLRLDPHRRREQSDLLYFKDRSAIRDLRSFWNASDAIKDRPSIRSDQYPLPLAPAGHRMGYDVWHAPNALHLRASQGYSGSPAAELLDLPVMWVIVQMMDKKP